jgi:predicted enzyme related to lactoylglutathione lyase
MSGSNHLFGWYELMTTDLDAAAAFYGKVVGWNCAAAPAAPPGMDYRLFAPHETPACPGPDQPMGVAGLMALPEQARGFGVPPHWLGHVDVASAAAALERAVSLGAKPMMPVTEVPNICRFAVLADPQGAVFGVMELIDPPPEAKPDYLALGHIGWHELYAADPDAAFGFYAALFGWMKREAMDMGPLGTYQFFGTEAQVLGGMMRKPAQMPVAAWGYYVNVADIDAAMAATTAGGGRVVHGPIQVPGGRWVINAVDPQGAVFNLVGGRKG